MRKKLIGYWRRIASEIYNELILAIELLKKILAIVVLLENDAVLKLTFQ
jgi:hypothetical protein